MRKLTKVSIGLILMVVIASPLRAMEPDQLNPGDLLQMTPSTAHIGFVDGDGGGLGDRATGSTLGIDTIPNFSSYFYDPGADGNGGRQFTWQYTMVGRSPFRAEADDSAPSSFPQGDNEFGQKITLIDAPVIPVTLDLRNADGSPRFVNGRRLISSPDAVVGPAVESPIFQPTTYSSSYTPTQFTDALLRADFYGSADPGWHTLLKPSVKPGRTLVLKQGTYRFALNPDGTCCYFVVVDITAFENALFPSRPGDTGSAVGQAEVADDIAPADISTFLFANTFLYTNNNPAQCCIIGFHSYDPEPGDRSNGFRERRYVLNYSSWISPGIFANAGPLDVAALSHELAETFHDPFVNNATPWWLAPNGLCQNNLETGDVIEGLPGAIKTIYRGNTAYHLQNEALLPWFAGQAPSTAINGAYSYPDPILSSAAVSQTVNCGAAFSGAAQVTAAASR
jgi:hypothetical protein